MWNIECRVIVALYCLCIYQCKYVFLLSDDGNMLPVKVLHQFYNPWCNTAVRGNRAQESGEAVLIRQSRRCRSY